MHATTTSFRVAKRCTGPVSDGPQHCAFAGATVTSDRDTYYECAVPLGAVSSATTLDAMNAEATLVQTFANSGIALGSGAGEACSTLDIRQPPAAATPSRYQVVDDALYGALLPALCNRTVVNTVGATQGRCPSVPTMGRGAQAVASCPATLSLNSTLGTVCGQWRQDVLAGAPRVTTVEGIQAGSWTSGASTVSSSSRYTVSGDPRTYRAQLDDVGETFCAANRGETSPHPLCRCVDRSLMPEYQLMQATSNGSDACWWTPCKDRMAQWAIVPQRLDASLGDCPTIDCTNILDLSDLYATRIDVANLTFLASCQGQQVTQISGATCPSGSVSASAAPALPGDVDPFSFCPKTLDKLTTCAADICGGQARVLTVPCADKTGIAQTLCVAWNSSWLFPIIALALVGVTAVLLGLAMWAVFGSLGGGKAVAATTNTTPARTATATATSPR